MASSSSSGRIWMVGLSMGLSYWFIVCTWTSMKIISSLPFSRTSCICVISSSLSLVMTTYSLEKGLMVRSTVRMVSLTSPYFYFMVYRMRLKLLSWAETSSTLLEIMCIDPVDVMSVSMKMGLISEGMLEDSLIVVVFVFLLYSTTYLSSWGLNTIIARMKF